MENICAICGRPAEAQHHLIFGRALRSLADADGLVIPLCNKHHNFGSMAIHDNTSAEQLSKMLGQMMWERNKLVEALEACDKDFAKYADKKVREDFMYRYGRSWL